MANNTSIQSAEGAKLCKTRQPAAFLYGRRSWPWYRQREVSLAFLQKHYNLYWCVLHVHTLQATVLVKMHSSYSSYPVLLFASKVLFLYFDLRPVWRHSADGRAATMWKYINGESALTCQRDQPSPQKNIAVAPGCSGISILDTAGDLN